MCEDPPIEGDKHVPEPQKVGSASMFPQAISTFRKPLWEVDDKRSHCSHCKGFSKLGGPCIRKTIRKASEVGRDRPMSPMSRVEHGAASSSSGRDGPQIP